MLPIQPGRRRQCNKKLAPVRILPAVRHTQDAGPGMLQRRIDLVFELFAVDGSAAAAGAGGVAGLQHEVWDYAVEDDVVVVAALGEGGEVVAGLEDRGSARRGMSKMAEELGSAVWSLRTLGAWLL